MLPPILAAESLLGVAREMRVARGGLDPVVAQQLPDHAQVLAERQRTARPGMTQVMDAHNIYCAEMSGDVRR